VAFVAFVAKFSVPSVARRDFPRPAGRSETATENTEIWGHKEHKDHKEFSLRFETFVSFVSFVANCSGPPWLAEPSPSRSAY